MSEKYGYNPEEFEQSKVKKAIDSTYTTLGEKTRDVKVFAKDVDGNVTKDENENIVYNTETISKKEDLKTTETHFKDNIYEQIDANQDFKQWDEEIAFLESPKIIPDKEDLLSIKKQILNKYKQVNQKFFSLGKERSRQAALEQKNKNSGKNLSPEFAQLNKSYLDVKNQIIALESMLLRLDAVQEKHSIVYDTQPKSEKFEKATTSLTEDKETSKETLVEQPKKNNTADNIEEQGDLQSSTELSDNSVAENKEKETGNISDFEIEAIKWQNINLSESIKQTLLEIVAHYKKDSPELTIIAEALDLLSHSNSNLNEKFFNEDDYLINLFLDFEIIFEDIGYDLDKEEQFFIWLEKEFNELRTKDPSEENNESKKETKIVIPDLNIANLEKKIDFRINKIDKLTEEINSNENYIISTLCSSKDVNKNISFLNSILYSTKEYQDDSVFLLDQEQKKDSGLKNLKKVNVIRERIVKNIEILKTKQSELFSIILTSIRKISEYENLNNSKVVLLLQSRIAISKKSYDSQLEQKSEILKTIDDVLVEFFLSKLSKTDLIIINNEKNKELQFKNYEELFTRTINEIMVDDREIVNEYVKIISNDYRLSSAEVIADYFSPESIEIRLKKILSRNLDQEKYGIYEAEAQAKEIKQLLRLIKERQKNKSHAIDSKLQQEIEDKLKECEDICESVRVTALEKKLLNFNDVNSFIGMLFFDGVRNEDEYPVIEKKLNHLLDKKARQYYEKKIKEIENGDYLEKQKKEMIQKVEQEYKDFCEYVKNMLNQIACGAYSFKNINVDTFQERAAGGSSKLIGKLNSDGSIETGIWNNATAWTLNIAFNQIAVVGIKEGFDPIAQKNKEGVGEGKLQTIVAEINDILGNPHKYTKKYAEQHPEYIKYIEKGIISNKFNVDSIITGVGKEGSLGKELVNSLMTLHKDDLFQNEWQEENLEDNDILATYRQGIMYLAARNDLTSTNFIKLVGTKNKSLHSTCAEALRPFGVGCAQVRALYKGDVGGYLSLTDSYDMSRAIKEDEVYQNLEGEAANFYKEIEEIQNIYLQRELVDSPQREAIRKRKHIFKPVKWHQGYVPRAFIACSLGKVSEGTPSQRDAAPSTYLEAASAFMKIAEYSIKPYNPNNVTPDQIKNHIAAISTQCSILTAFTGSSFEENDGELGHINQAALALFETAIEKILISIEGQPRKNSLGLIDKEGRKYIHEYQKIKRAIVDIISDKSRTKEPFSSKLCEFIGANDPQVDQIFMNETEHTGFLGKNYQRIRNYKYNVWIEENQPDRVEYYIDGLIDSYEQRRTYPEPVLSVDPQKPWSAKVFEE